MDARKHKGLFLAIGVVGVVISMTSDVVWGAPITFAAFIIYFKQPKQ
jgi:hypothetical protein